MTLNTRQWHATHKEPPQVECWGVGVGVEMTIHGGPHLKRRRMSAIVVK